MNEWTDEEILIAWLAELSFGEYFHLFKNKRVKKIICGK